jgi:hypothetical protein
MLFAIWGDVPIDPQYGTYTCLDFPNCSLGTCFNDFIPESSFTLTAAVPEPTTLSLLGASLFGSGVFRRRRKS